MNSTRQQPILGVVCTGPLLLLRGTAVGRTERVLIPSSSRFKARTRSLREAAVLIAAGIAAGLVIALAAGKLAASLLYGITPHEPVTLATATAVLVAAGLLASYWPARAATRIEPTVALRAD